MGPLLEKIKWYFSNLEDKELKSWDEVFHVLHKLPARSHIRISKGLLATSPPWNPSRLGFQKKCLKQYRSDHAQNGIHLREYKDCWIVHIDKFNPKKHMIKHWFYDVPEYTTAGIAILGLLIYTGFAVIK